MLPSANETIAFFTRPVVPETTPEVEEYGTFGQREKRINLQSNVEVVDNISIELPPEKPPRMPLR